MPYPASATPPLRASTFPSRNRALDEFLVPADPEVGEHRIDDALPAVDQEGCAPDTNAERAIDIEGLDRRLALVRQQREGQGMLLAETAVALRAIAG